MFKKSASIILCVSIFALNACSDEKPKLTENLRKIGSPIQGNWQVADFTKCKPDAPARNIKITTEQIELINTYNKTNIVMFENMIQYITTKLIIISGKLFLYDITGERTLAFFDEGDKLIFAGFFVDNKLINRQDLLERYNADGNAERNMKTLDFNFCSKL